MVGAVLCVVQLNVIDKKQEIAQLRREEEVKRSDLDVKGTTTVQDVPDTKQSFLFFLRNIMTSLFLNYMIRFKKALTVYVM